MSSAKWSVCLCFVFLGREFVSRWSSATVFLVARTQLFSPLNTFGLQQDILYSAFLWSLGGNVVYLYSSQIC